MGCFACIASDNEGIPSLLFFQACTSVMCAQLHQVLGDGAGSLQHDDPAGPRTQEGPATGVEMPPGDFSCAVCARGLFTSHLKPAPSEAMLFAGVPHLWLEVDKPVGHNRHRDSAAVAGRVPGRRLHQ